MELSIPAALKSISSAGKAISELAAWKRKARGDARSLIGELKDNMTYLDMVAKDDVELGDVIQKISITEYKRLAKEGYDFNSLKTGKIASFSSLEGTELSSWKGKKTGDLVESIYDKLNKLKIRYPHVSNNKKYRWNVRVNNIRKRIWLLLKHVRG
ncbi:MAG: hypothetical protein P8X93_07745 [Gammaproteobacteria bacterium]